LGWLRANGLFQRAIEGFTLAELFIALAILGVIATFSISEIVASQQNQSYNAKAKQISAAVTSALDTYRLNNRVTSNTSMGDLTPYLNYAYANNNGAYSVDGWSSFPGTYTCSGIRMCIFFHNGSALYYHLGGIGGFGGTATTNAIWFNFDPDTRVKNPSSSVSFVLYTNSRLGTASAVLPGARNDWGPIPTGPDPFWFSWK
jgi:prepilin-type N-terminal cleavage/methylation domain-containing protein